MPSGKVKFFNAERGFGFILPADGGRDVFVHMKALRRAKLKSLEPGQVLEYELSDERGKPEAINLRLPT